MANRMRESRQAAGMSLRDLACAVDLNPVHIALVERGEALVRLGAVSDLSQALGRPAWELFPDAAKALRKLDEATPEEQERMLDDQTVFRTLLDASIDPDPAIWVAVIEFANGVTRKYPVCCIDLQRLREWFRSGTSGYITFQSDSRIVGLSRDAVRLCALSKTSEWRPWDPGRQGMEVVFVRLGDDRPSSYMVCFDEPIAEERGQFQRIVTLFDSHAPQGFVEFTDENEETFFVPLQEIAAIEIPMGILDEDLYRWVDAREPPLEQLEPTGVLH